MVFRAGLHGELERVRLVESDIGWVGTLTKDCVPVYLVFVLVLLGHEIGGQSVGLIEIDNERFGKQLLGVGIVIAQEQFLF